MSKRRNGLVSILLLLAIFVGAWAFLVGLITLIVLGVQSYIDLF